MTEDEQLLYDEYRNLKELEARFTRQAEAYEKSAKDQRTIASGYGTRAAVLARQLGLTV